MLGGGVVNQNQQVVLRSLLYRLLGCCAIHTMLREEGLLVGAYCMHQFLLVLLAINQLETRLAYNQSVVTHWCSPVQIYPLLLYLLRYMLFLLVKHRA